MKRHEREEEREERDDENRRVENRDEIACVNFQSAVRDEIQ